MTADIQPATCLQKLYYAYIVLVDCAKLSCYLCVFIACYIVVPTLVCTKMYSFGAHALSYSGSFEFMSTGAVLFEFADSLWLRRLCACARACELFGGGNLQHKESITSYVRKFAFKCWYKVNMVKPEVLNNIHYSLP